MASGTQSRLDHETICITRLSSYCGMFLSPELDLAIYLTPLYEICTWYFSTRVSGSLQGKHLMYTSCSVRSQHNGPKFLIPLCNFNFQSPSTSRIKDRDNSHCSSDLHGTVESCLLGLSQSDGIAAEVIDAVPFPQEATESR